MNHGPSFLFKLRDAQGQAYEYENYMSPIFQEGRLFFLSGMRASVAEPMRFLHIPADPQGSVERFMRFRAVLNDQETVHATAEQRARNSLQLAKVEDSQLLSDIVTSMTRLVGLFRDGGFEAVGQHVEATVPADRQEQVFEAYLKVLHSALGALYVGVLEQEGIDVSAGVSETDALFYDDAINALASVPAYGAPFYLQLTDFKHIQASGLQITRAPGQNVVYLGCVMLIAGIFMMFYISHRRLWLRVSLEEGRTRVLFAGTGNRNQADFAKEFTKLKEELGAFLKAPADPS